MPVGQASEDIPRVVSWERAEEIRRRRQQRQRRRQRERLSRRAFLALLGGGSAYFGYRWLGDGWLGDGWLGDGWLGERLSGEHWYREGPRRVISGQPTVMPDVASSPALDPDPDPSTPARSNPPGLSNPARSNPVQIERISIQGIPLYRTTIDLTDPATFVAIGLAKDAPQANSHQSSVGDESFASFVQRYSNAAAVLSGTFFSQDAQKRVMGNMVSGGRFLKYSRWENYGTTLGIREGNRLEMVTARTEGQPQWNEHWFSLTSGPRLLREGKVWMAPKSEGFRDPHVLGVGSRKAIGYPRGGGKLIIATFLSSLSLAQEAKAMKALGCYEAMNLDGGFSVGLARQGQVILDAERPLTNVLVVYDAEHPAPELLRDSWHRFQAGERPQQG